jgi:hypothetical protein
VGAGVRFLAMISGNRAGAKLGKCPSLARWQRCF